MADCLAGLFSRVRAGDVNYAVAMLDGRPIGGLVEKRDPGRSAPTVGVADLFGRE